MALSVQTFIVFRSSTPLMVAIADSAFMGKPWPSKSTFASLVVILAGAVAYVLTDSQFTVTAYFWALVYLATITFEVCGLRGTGQLWLVLIRLVVRAGT